MENLLRNIMTGGEGPLSNLGILISLLLLVILRVALPAHRRSALRFPVFGLLIHIAIVALEKLVIRSRP